MQFNPLESSSRNFFEDNIIRCTGKRSSSLEAKVKKPHKFGLIRFLAKIWRWLRYPSTHMGKVWGKIHSIGLKAIRENYYDNTATSLEKLKNLQMNLQKFETQVVAKHNRRRIKPLVWLHLAGVRIAKKEKKYKEILDLTEQKLNHITVHRNTVNDEINMWKSFECAQEIYNQTSLRASSSHLNLMKDHNQQRTCLLIQRSASMIPRATDDQLDCLSENMELALRTLFDADGINGLPYAVREEYSRFKAAITTHRKNSRNIFQQNTLVNPPRHTPISSTRPVRASSITTYPVHDDEDDFEVAKDFTTSVSNTHISKVNVNPEELLRDYKALNEHLEKNEHSQAVALLKKHGCQGTDEQVLTFENIMHIFDNPLEESFAKLKDADQQRADIEAVREKMCAQFCTDVEPPLRWETENLKSFDGVHEDVLELLATSNDKRKYDIANNTLVIPEDIKTNAKKRLQAFKNENAKDFDAFLKDIVQRANVYWSGKTTEAQWSFDISTLVPSLQEAIKEMGNDLAFLENNGAQPDTQKFLWAQNRKEEDKKAVSTELSASVESYLKRAAYLEALAEHMTDDYYAQGLRIIAKGFCLGYNPQTICSISQDLIDDNCVRTKHQETYHYFDKDMIEAYIRMNGKDPEDRKPLNNNELEPVPQEIVDYVEEYKNFATLQEKREKSAPSVDLKELLKANERTIGELTAKVKALEQVVASLGGVFEGQRLNEEDAILKCNQAKGMLAQAKIDNRTLQARIRAADL